MSLCNTCTKSIKCPTWSETKCTELKTRIYSKITTCKYYKKRDKNFKEPKCQCESCLKNEALYEENE
jgi:hypothetical protein